MKRIEKPDFTDFIVCNARMTDMVGSLGSWFDEHIEPLNKLIDKDIAVTGFMEHRGNWVWSEEPSEADTHKAYLIGIEPIEKDSAEKVLRDLLDRSAHGCIDIVFGKGTEDAMRKAILKERE